MSTLQDELGISYNLPSNKTDDTVINISDTVKIYLATLDYSTPYNPRIQYLDGPYWDYSTGVAVGTFVARDNPIESTKAYMKSIVATNRYNKEVAGTTANIQSTVVSIDTDRTTRNMFFQKYVLMGADDVVSWKFPEGWLTLTKTDLGDIVAAAVNYIQIQFDWESIVVTQIDSATTLAELAAINLE
jgi:hypothetical protein